MHQPLLQKAKIMIHVTGHRAIVIWQDYIFNLWK